MPQADFAETSTFCFFMFFHSCLALDSHVSTFSPVLDQCAQLDCMYVMCAHRVKVKNAQWVSWQSRYIKRWLEHDEVWSFQFGRGSPSLVFFTSVSFAPKIDCKIAGGRIGTSTSSSIFVRPSVGITIDSGSHLHRAPGVPLFALQACGTHAMSKRCKPCPAPPSLCCLLG